MNMDKNQLTEKERKELELLDNPQIMSMGSATLWGNIFGSNPLNNKSKRKERVSELRTKNRMLELKLDPNKDWQKYYEIRKEEEKRFDERFKNVM